MAVNANLLTYPEANFSPQDFSIMLERVSVIKTGILYGCNVTKLSTNSVNVDEGWVTVRGRLIKIEEGSLSMTLPSSGTKKYYVLVTVDLSNSAKPATCSIAASVPSDDEEFNFIDGKAYCVLATVSTSTTDITSIVIPAIVDPFERYVTTVTLSSGSWSSNKYSFESTYPSTTYDIFVELNGNSCTLNQAKAWSKAMIVGSPTENKIKALNGSPSVDIPATIIAEYKR